MTDFCFTLLFWWLLSMLTIDWSLLSTVKRFWLLALTKLYS